MGLVPTGYPMELEDDDLQNVMRDLSKSINDGNINDVMRTAPFITLGQTELMARQAKATGDETRKLAQETEKMASGSMTARNIGIIATIVAALSLIATATFGYLDWQGDKLWQSEQIAELRDLQSQMGSSVITDRQAIADLSAAIERLGTEIAKRERL